VRPDARVDPRPLAAVAALAVALAALGVLPRWPGLVHVVALPPLDLVSEFGFLLVHAGGWPVLAAGAAAAVLVRSAVLALLLGGLTWRRYLLALRFYLLVAPLSFLAAGLLYGAAAVMLYALFWAGLALVLLLLGATAALPWGAGERLRSAAAASARSGFRLGTVGCYLALLLAVGAAADVGGPVAAVLLVPVSAALTWAAATALVADPGWRAVRRAVAALPAAGVVVVLAVVALGPAAPPAPAGEAPDAREGSLLLMSGIDSSSGSGAILEIDPRTLGWTCETTRYFSYAGPGEGQPQGDALCPIPSGAPYGPQDTLRSRDELIPFLEQQVADMPPPVVVATHSQGVWLVWEAAASGRLPGVETVVAVGAFSDSGVAYPAGEGEEGAPGWAGRELRVRAADLPRPGGTTVFEPDSPLGQEWLGDPQAVRDVLARPLPEGMRALSVASSFDLPLMRGTHRLPGAVDACPVPVVHPNLPYAEDLHEAVRRFLDGEQPASCPPWRTAPGPVLRHFSVPPADAP
jgi:hypothetical protein